MSIGRSILTWAVATSVGYGLASVILTGTKLQKFAASGYPIEKGDWPGFIYSDMKGLVLYFVVLAIAFAVAFLIASGAKRVLRPLAPIAYPVAGAAAVAMALFAIAQFAGGFIPIEGAQSLNGQLMQMGAGAIAGLVFEVLRAKS